MSYDKFFYRYRIDLTIKQKYDIIIIDDREVLMAVERTITIHDKVNDIDRELTLSNVSDIKYRSHRCGKKCTNPNNWLLVIATDKFGFEYECWYYIKDINIIDLDNIDYDNPNDVITRRGRIYIR